MTGLASFDFGIATNTFDEHGQKWVTRERSRHCNHSLTEKNSDKAHIAKEL
jgi:hypothetical protein